MPERQLSWCCQAEKKKICGRRPSLGTGTADASYARPSSKNSWRLASSLLSRHASQSQPCICLVSPLWKSPLLSTYLIIWFLLSSLPGTGKKKVAGPMTMQMDRERTNASIHTHTHTSPILLATTTAHDWHCCMR